METDFYSRLAFLLMILYLMIMKIVFRVIFKKLSRSYLPEESYAYEHKRRFALKIVIFIVLIVITAGYLLNLPFVKIFTLSTLMLLKWTGFIVGGISLLFWTWVQLVSGGVWPVSIQLNKEHELITAGPYKNIRHPLYAAMILWLIGISILTTNLLFIGFSLLSIIFMLLRIPKEEKRLIITYGDQYEEYMRRTGRLFPKTRMDNSIGNERRRKYRG